jgi:hypothetical protein
MAERMVPNPRHLRLKSLLRRAEDEIRGVRHAFLPAVTAMDGGTVWTGPTARKWATDLGEQHHRLIRATERVIGAVEAELRRHPPMVTEAEADLIRRELTGRI